jgi:glycosyltransferase involved in cell wall biosynthesis
MITVLPVFREEGWHSMDLCSDMLVKHVPQDATLEVGLPKFKKILGYLSFKKSKNFDRWYNRWRVYPYHVQRLASNSKYFHIVDHSYAHLVNYLPEGRVGVYCHDLDAFKCILNPDQEFRPQWFKKMMGGVFDGLKKARIIFCSTKITRESLLSLGHWKSNQIHIVPYGIADEFKVEGPKESGEFLLHVGSCISRKRIDVLLRAFSEVCKKANHPNLKLIQAGGSFSIEQRKQILDLGLVSRVEQRQNLAREDLARLYRGTKCLVITSDAEGFGLPVIEGLSCGARVVASNIPAMREVGGSDIKYFTPGNPIACAESISKELSIPVDMANFPKGKWSWVEHAKKICCIYKSIDSL